MVVCSAISLSFIFINESPRCFWTLMKSFLFLVFTQKSWANGNRLTQLKNITLILDVYLHVPVEDSLDCGISFILYSTIRV